MIFKNISPRLLTFCIGAMTALPALSATFTVTDTRDTVDAAPGDGACADANGACTLRAAVQEANAIAGPHEIVLLTGTYSLTRDGAGEDLAATGDLDISNHITLRGVGAAPSDTVIAAAFSVGAPDRVLHLVPDIVGQIGDAQIIVRNVTIQNGRAGFAGGVLVNESFAHVTLQDCVVRANRATDTSGGGISLRAYATLLIDNCLIEGNAARTYGGGVTHRGGTLTLRNTTVRGNTAAAGAGIGIGFAGAASVPAGSAVIVGSTVSGNTAQNPMGIADGTGVVIVSGGGGIGHYTGTLTVINSTLSGNTAHWGAGYYQASGHSAEFFNATVANNSASAGGAGIYRAATAASGSASGAVTLRNTLVALNQANADCGGAPLTSGGHNLIGSVGGCVVAAVAGDQFGDASAPINPRLFALANFGGATETHALAAASPAVDAGNIMACTNAAGAALSDDQRGFVRPADGHCDIGAFEFAAPGVVVTPSAGLVTSESGGAATFTVRLASRPTHAVTIGVASSNSGEGTVAPASLTFDATNWRTAQTVTVTGVDDVYADGANAYTIVTAPALSGDFYYSGVNAMDVGVSNSDDEIAGITVTPTAGLNTSEAGGSANFSVALNTPPRANVVIALSSTHPGEGTVTPASLVFTSTNWNIPQTVTVTGVDDNADDGTISYSIVIANVVSVDPAYSGLNPADVSLTNSDNDVLMTELMVAAELGDDHDHGGCVLRRGRAVDPMLPLLVAVALGYVLRRRRRA